MNVKLGAKPNNYTKRNIIALLCVITALFIGIQPAFAGGLSDIITTALATVISFICKVIAGFQAKTIELFLKGMGTDITEYRSMGLLAGFDTFTGIIKAIGIGIACVAVAWQLFAIMFGPVLGIKQEKSVGLIIFRALLFIPLTYGIQNMAEAAFSAMQSVYSAILSGYTNAVMGATEDGTYTGLVNAMTDNQLINEFVATGGAAETFTVIGVLISAIILILVLWNFLKLVFEAIQRFAVMIVYVYLSPLAAACGVVGDGSIPKKALGLFFSSGILWILNIWCIGVAQSLISLYASALSNGTTGLMAWIFLNYGFIKIAQQLDDIFNTVGATNVRLNGDLLRDILGLEKPYRWAANNIPKLFHKGGTGSPTSGAGANNANAPKGAQNAAAAASAAAATQRPLSQEAKKELDNARSANGSINRDEALEAVAKNMGIKGGADAVMNDPRVKDYIARNQMGLMNNQSLVKMEGTTGNEQAIVATKKADGSISFNKVGNLGKATNGGGNTFDPECDRYSPNETVGSFNSDTAGKNNAVFKYTGTDGVTRAAQVDSNGPGSFIVTPTNGDSITVSAPQNATAGEVASMLNGSASEATRQKFENQSYAADAKTVSSVQSDFNIDSSKGGSVMGGTFFENSPNTTATILSKDPQDNVTLYRTSCAAEGQTEDTWTAEWCQTSTSFNVPKGMGAAQVTSEYIRQAGEDINDAEGVPTIGSDSKIEFTSDHKAVGSDIMQPEIADTYSGSRINGTVWSDAINLKYDKDKHGNSRIDMSYEGGNNNTPFSLIETNNDFGGNVTGDKYYTVVSDSIEGGSATFRFNKDANINEVAAALMSGDPEPFDLGDKQSDWENIVRNIGFVGHDNFMRGNSNFKSVIDKEDVTHHSFGDILNFLNENFNTENNPVGDKK